MKVKLGKCLIFLEDPGAANYFYRVIKPLQTELELLIIVEGYAKGFLASRLSAKYCDLDTDVLEYLSKHNVKLVITGTSENPVSNSFKLIEAARRLDILVIGIVDGPGSAGQRFRGLTQAPLFWAPEWLIVPDNTTASLYINQGFDSERIKIFSHPQYELALSLSKTWTKEDKLKQRKKFLKGSNERPILMFISEISTGLNPESYKRSDYYTLHGTSGHDGRTEIVLEELLVSLQNIVPKPYMVLRLHPKQTPDDLKAYLEYFDYVSQTDPALEIVNACDIIVGMTSSLLVEAFYLGKPVLAIVPDQMEKIYLGDLANVIKCVSRREDIMIELAGYAGQKPAKYSLKAISQSVSQITQFVNSVYHSQIKTGSAE